MIQIISFYCIFIWIGTPNKCLRLNRRLQAFSLFDKKTRFVIKLMLCIPKPCLRLNRRPQTFGSFWKYIHFSPNSVYGWTGGRRYFLFVCWKRHAFFDKCFLSVFIIFDKYLCQYLSIFVLYLPTVLRTYLLYGTAAICTQFVRRHVDFHDSWSGRETRNVTWSLLV